MAECLIMVATHAISWYVHRMSPKEDCPLCGHKQVPLREVQRRSYGFCPGCRGIFAERASLPDPRQELAEYLKHNNDVDDPRYRAFARPLVDLVASRQGPKDRGLDFGAGPGPVVTRMLAERGYSLALYDPYFHKETSVLDDTYDFIVCCEVIEHFYTPAESFRLLARLLAPGGTLYCRTTLVPDDIPFLRWHYKNEATHVFFYHRETIAWLASCIMRCEHTILDKNLIMFTRST